MKGTKQRSNQNKVSRSYAFFPSDII